MIEFTLRFVWVPTNCGGHRSGPWVGMRSVLRWQNHIDEWLHSVRDAECIDLDFDKDTGRGVARMKASLDPLLESKRLEAGEPVELLDGMRVIAVGCIVRDLGKQS